MKASQLFFNLIILIFVCTQTITHPILHQIAITKRLIALYEQKLQILMEQARQQNITIFQIENIQNKTNKQPKSLLKLEQQLIFQVNSQIGKNVMYVSPGYIVTQGYIKKLDNLQMKGQKYVGDVIYAQPYQITFRIDEKKIKIINLKQAIVQKQLNIHVRNQPGKWHHATQFQSLFLQSNSQALTISNQKQTQQYKFKSQLVSFFTIHQYKLLFVTRLSYGFINPKSFQISSQTNFEAIVQSAYYNNQERLLFILFKNGNLTIIEHEKIVGMGQIERRDYFIIQNIKMEYLGRNYLFIYGHTSCFDIYQIAAPSYTPKFFKHICIPNIKNSQQPHVNYQYQFFKHENIYKLILTANQQNSKLYHIILPQRQLTTQKNYPWKPILVVLGIIIVVYWKSKNSKKEQNEFNDQNRNERKNMNMNKKIKKQKNNQNINSNNNNDYIKQIESQIKKKKLDHTKFD